MAVTNNVNIVIKATENLTRELGKMKKGLEGFQDRVKELQPTFKKMAGYGTAGFVAISGAMGKFISDAKEAEGVRNSFERLSKGIGQNSSDILDSLRKASKGTIDDTNLMLNANKAMVLGVASNTEEFTTLMEIARVKGQAMGLTMEQAFGDIVTGLGRGSAMILDNLGITVNATEAQEEYARSIGKTASELTEAEKKQALINKVVSDGKKELEQAGEVALTTAEKQAQLQATLSNLSGTIGEALIPAFDNILTSIAPVIEKVSNWIGENPKLTATLIKVSAGVAGVVAVLGTLGLVIPTIITTIGALGTALSFLALNPIGMVITAIGAGIAIGVLIVKNWEKIKEKATEIWNYIGDFFKTILGDIVDYFSPFINVIKQIYDFIMPKLSEAFENTMDFISTISQNTVEFVTGIFQGLKDFIEGIISFATGAYNRVKSIGEKVSKIGSSIKEGASNIVGKVTGAKAVGGVVNAGSTYKVGEQGPEYFTPTQNGIISRAGTNTTANININLGGVTIQNSADENRLVEKIKRSLSREAKSYNLGIS